MSGVEAPGLALAVIPLLTAACSGYEKSLGLFKRFRNFTVEAERFCLSLGVQKTIFRGQYCTLLEDIGEHDVATDLLNGSISPKQLDPSLERQIAHRLGHFHGACMDSIKLIGERLQDVEKESRRLGTILDQEE